MSLLQRAKLLALTRAAYTASEGVAPWDTEDGEGESRVAEPPGGRRSRRTVARRRLTPRAVLAVVLLLATATLVVVLRAAVAADATQSTVSTGSGSTASGEAPPPGPGTEGASDPGASAAADPTDAAPSPTPAGTAAAPDGLATAPSGAATAPSGSASTASGSVVVHVAGEVLAPGVVELPAGSRVSDALQAAGGATDQADLAAINLARVVLDGEQVRVPAPGEEVEPQAPAGSGLGVGTEGEAGADEGVPVDLNSATLAQLDALPGIGPALSQRIVDWRTEHGGFQDVAELELVSGIGPAVMADLEGLVSVG